MVCFRSWKQVILRREHLVQRMATGSQSKQHIKLLSFERPSLLHLAYPSETLPETLSCSSSSLSEVIQHVQQANDITVQGAFLPSQSEMIFSTGSPPNQRYKSVPVCSDEWRYRICLFHRAKGPGFVAIGKDWGGEAKLFDFGDGFTREGVEQAHHVAELLEDVLRYRMTEEDYGADF